MDRTCVWIGGKVRWGVWIEGVKQLTGEGKLTVGLRLGRWSDYHEGEDQLAKLGVTRSELDWCEWLDPCEFVAELSSFSRSLALLRMTQKWFEVKNESVKSFLGQRSKLLVKGNDFPENSIFHSCQTRGSGGKWFPESIYHQNKRTLNDNQAQARCIDINRLLVQGDRNYAYWSQ